MTCNPMQTRRSVLLVRSYPIDTDSRSQKMLEAYRLRGFVPTILCWTRGREIRECEDVLAFRRPAEFGGGWRSLLAFLSWHLFIARHLISNRNHYDAVHTVDFDTAVITVPLGWLCKLKIIYDAFDHFGSSRKNALLRQIFSAWERLLIYRSDLVILPNERRIRQYGIKPRAAIRIISNIPEDIPLAGKADVGASVDGQECRLRLCYVGTLEKRHRGLEYIPRLCKDFPDIEFSIGGLGALEQMFTADAAALTNLDFVGFLSYPEALNVMRQSDCLFGPYLLSSRHHEFASPNKMFEHLLLGKPLITNSGTPVAEFVEANETGFIFDGGYDSLREIVGGLTRRICEIKGRAAAKRWREKYASQRQAELDSFFAEFAHWK